MPSERPLTIAGYAAGASLAAITLVYVFGPTFFFDDEAANSSRSSRKKGVVGLSNPANDCFINSVLQALAGLPQLRLYLIRECHRRKLGGTELYRDLAAAVEEQEEKMRKEGSNSKPMPQWKILNLQEGLVTAGLKEILDALNERPIYKKTMSASPFIRVVEQAFRTRISRSQQDAQEFLQIIAERLNDEHHAGRRVRRHARRNQSLPSLPEAKQTVLDVDSTAPAGARDSKIEEVDGAVDPAIAMPTSSSTSKPNEPSVEDDDDEDEPFTFPFEGKLSSELQCSYCQFQPRPHVSTFVTLTLHVPQNNGAATSLNSCFDGMFKQETIDDFTCDRCRLVHALEVNAAQLSKTGLTDDEQSTLLNEKDKIDHALREDPEKPPPDLTLPPLSSAPKRKIQRHTRISSFPRILSLHLSRSVWDASSSTSKNTAKVAFPESLPLGSLLDRKTYRLLGVVTHKGGHNSGHYESFRRQFLSRPYSTPASMGTEGIYSLRSSPAPSPRVSAAPSPSLSGKTESKDKDVADHASLALDSPPPSSHSSLSPASSDKRAPPPTSVPLDAIPTPGLPTPPGRTDTDTQTSLRRQSSLSGAVSRVRRKKGPERWWRISDERVKESKTSEVLGMQREVYLLFYEMVEDV